MPIYEYECRLGHRTEDFVHTSSARKAEIRCGSCRRKARYVVSCPAPPMGDVEKNAVQPHFNPAFGTVVKDRKHMKYLQKVHGTQDWRPARGKNAREEITDMLKRTGKADRAKRAAGE